jgi:hypothetical protein
MSNNIDSKNNQERQIIVDLSMLVMAITDSDGDNDPHQAHSSLAEIILSKYKAYSENISPNFVNLAFYWFEAANNSAIVESNEDILSYILSLKDLVYSLEEALMNSERNTVNLKQ